MIQTIQRVSRTHLGPGVGVGIVCAMLLGLGGCLPLSGTPASPGGAEVLLFYVENRTDRPAHLQVLGDQDLLFSVDLEAASVVGPSGGSAGRELPPGRRIYPGREIKVPVLRYPRRLEVHETLRDWVKTLSLQGLRAQGGVGHRIVVSSDGIEIHSDYVPVR